MTLTDPNPIDVMKALVFSRFDARKISTTASRNRRIGLTHAMADCPSHPFRISPMNTKALILCLATVLPLAACDRDDPNDTPADTPADTAGTGTDAAAPGNTPTDTTTPATGATPTTPGMDAAGAAATANLSEAERGALGVLNAINEHEIAAGQQALSKNVPDDVAKFAQMMVDEHSKNRDQTNRFGPNADDAKAAAQRSKGKAELDTLGKQSGDGYAKAYVDAMVKGHAEALAALDNDLIPAATDPAVKTHLTDTRTAVAKHLESAKQLQGGGK
jgi:putative membrane protein